MRNTISALTVIVVLIAGDFSISAADKTVRPNVVFILADDLGWSDTTLFGTTKFYQTPNIERLAKRGMTFSRAYAASPLCSPTRASILTGLNPARIGITAPVCHTKSVRLKASVNPRGPANAKTLACQSATRLRPDYDTLAESLKEAGYATGHFGKWHLGPEPYDPLHHGFDVDIPHWPGPGPAGSYVAPWRFPKFKERKPGEHIEDRMGDEAVAFMKQHKDSPFFLNYWQFSVHAPFDAKPDLIRKHRARVDPKSLQRSPTYAAMVESFDDNVGKILDAVDQLGIADRTIIIFFSDNGGNMYNEIDGTTPTNNAPLRGGKATMYEGGVRVPCIISWPGIVKKATQSDAVIQSVDFFPTILDMLGLHAKTGQSFDGISIVPALKGRTLTRKEIFTFFPHAPRVPDHLPPSVSVHRGRWKLIRIFHDGDKQQHRHELYDLAADVSERHNVAEKFPERVKQLDAAIDRFLTDTKAVVPRRNPAFSKESAKFTTHGIRPGKDCDLAIRNGRLMVKSTGKDPHFQLQLKKPIAAGQYTLTLRMSSTAKGIGQIFWQEKGVRPAFHRRRRITFHPTHDGKTDSYKIAFTASKPVTAIRIDPAQSPGILKISDMTITNAKGVVLQHWLPKPRD